MCSCGQVLDVPLCPYVLKHVLGLQDTLCVKDVADIDPQLCQSLEWMQENPVEDLGECVTLVTPLFNPNLLLQHAYPRY